MNHDFKRLGAVAVLLLIADLSQAQSLVWSHTWPGPERGVASIHADPAGNAFVNGFSYTPPDVPVGRFVTKLSFDGQELWTFNAGPGQVATSSFLLALAADGDAILVGMPPGGPTIDVLRLSGASGAVAWSTSHTEPGATGGLHVRALETDPSGEIACLVHHSSGPAPATVHTRLLRFGAAGNFRWGANAAPASSSMGSTGNVATDANGNTWYDETLPSGTINLNKVDAGGQVLWSTTYIDSRGPNQGTRGITVDALGTAHWYVSLMSTSTPLPTVEVRVDSLGQVAGTQDLPMNPGVEAYHRSGKRIAHAGLSLTSADRIIEVRADDGGLLWSAAVPPFGLAQFGGISTQLDPNGGALTTTRWILTQMPYFFLEHVRCDPSGHIVWQGGPSGAPLSPDTSTLRVSGGTFAQPLTAAKMDLLATGFCFGDGVLGACPCGNASAPSQAAGCAHSFGSGASLAGSGDPSLAADGLVLGAQGATGSALMIAQSPAFQANGAGTPFGDGLRCIGGNVVRIATRALAGGALQYPQAGDVSISVRGGVIAPGTRTYQGFFRNVAPFCTPSTQATTNGVAVHWGP